MAELQTSLPLVGSLVHLEAAERLRSFTRAAQELNYSQATVSRRIGELEKDLGVDLFERRRYDVVPTEDGVLLAASARRALRDLAMTTNQIRKRASQLNTLTVFSDLSLSTALIAPVLGEFQRAHPDLTIRVLSSFEPVAATAESYDVALQYGNATSTNWRVYPVADDSVFPVCSPEVAERFGGAVGYEPLTDLSLLHVKYDNTEWTDWSKFLAYVGTGGPPTAEGLTFSSYQVCLDVCERGEGVALGWERTVQPRLDSGRLVRFTDLVMPHPQVINAFIPTARAAHPLVDDFLALLANVVG